MRRTISIVVAAVLAIVVLITVVVAVAGGGGGSKQKSLKTVRGVIGSEKKPFFDDPRVKKAFADHGYDVQVDTAGSRSIATTVDLSKYDFAFPAGTPAAQKIKADHKVSTTYVPFVTPMAIATFKDIAQLLEKAGVAHDKGGYWTLDMKGFLDLVKRNVRWTELPGNTTYPATKFVLITSTDITTSNSAAMYAAIASYVANGNNVLSNPGDVDKVTAIISPLFLKQGYTEQSSEAPFNDYLTIGEGATPMVMIYEAQYIARAAAHDGSIDPARNVLMYPEPDLVSKHTLVPLGDAGDAVGRLLTDDPVLQELAVENGFRITSKPGAFNTFVKKSQITVQPNLLNVIEPPTYDNLEALIQRIEASLKATLGPRPGSGTELTTVPAQSAATQTTGSP